MKNLAFLYAWGTIVLAFISLLVVGYWMFYPYKIIEFKNEPFPTSSTKVKSGEVVQYVVEYCKYVDAPATTSRAFVNDLIFASPSFLDNWEIGCHSKNVTVSVPHELPTGKYHLEIYRSFEVNPIRNIEVDSRTQEFQVVE